MTKYLMPFLFALVLFGCDIRKNSKLPDPKSNNSAQTFIDSTSVQIIDSAYNFGNVNDGEKVEYNYRFINTGKNSLVISSARASCGCTVPEKPEEPIKPGEIGFLKVVFNSEGRVGAVHKEITVTSNAFPEFPVLLLTGQVLRKK